MNKMLTVQKKYITLPINVQTSKKKVIFKNTAGEIVHDLDCNLDAISPNFTAYVDVSRFMGETLEISVAPDMEYELGETDLFVSDEVYKEDLRPRIHFAVKNGWNNDPNGLIKMNGEYHMFYQYNPCSGEWGNMHWGHAVSRDLIHWEELDIALYPDRFGTMYSGCAIEDKNGICPLGDRSKSKMLLYYTAAGNNNLMSKGENFTQRLAWSEDGRSFTKYDDAPMIPHIIGGNRDPKVVWVEEIGCYILALYLDGNQFTMYRSDDLMNWSHFCDVTLPSDRECPDIFPIKCGNERLWVLAGASDFYIVGKFENNEFKIVSPEKRLNHNRESYAAQSFSGIEDDRIIRVYWQRPNIPAPAVTKQMSIPTEMSLKRECDDYYLLALPAKELDILREGSIYHKDVTLEQPIREDIGVSPLDITLDAEYLAEKTVTLRIFGASILLDMKNNCLQIEKQKMPLSLKKDYVKLRVIVDRCSIEIFADDGRYLLFARHLWDKNLPYVELCANAPVKIKSLEIHTLKSIHEN